MKIVLRGANGRVVDLEISGGVALPSPLHTVYEEAGPGKRNACSGAFVFRVHFPKFRTYCFGVQPLNRLNSS